MATLTAPFISKKETTTVSIPPQKGELNVKLLSQAVLIHQGNNHRPTAQTKTRGEVAGSNKKPWRQKGTGRARAGSRRSPIWIGGGITFGPSTEKNYKRNLTKSEKQSTLRTILALTAKNKRLIVIDVLPDLEKTKAAVKWLTTLPTSEGLISVITAGKTNNRAFNNISHINLQSILSPRFDRIIAGDWLVIEKKAFDLIAGVTEEKKVTKKESNA